MGYQNGNDNSQQTYNEKQHKSTHQRTSKTSELCDSTSKSQYDRLTGSGRPIPSSGPAIGKVTI